MKPLLLHVTLLAALCLGFFASAKGTFSFTEPQLLHSWLEVDFDWNGSPWGSRSAAIAAGAFIPANNVITGINEYNGTIFLCVPRWRHGVPATLVKVDNSTGSPVLQPWPSWDINTEVLNYVQSVFVDHHRGLMYVIDTGRMYFFGNNASEVVNTTAKLLVYEIHSAKLVYRHEFHDDIFPIHSSFLNDIVVDTEKNLAYMSDTNIAGLGAIVIHDLKTRQSVRFQDPASTFANRSYVTRILGINYPFDSPADGIALSSDGNWLYYSSVEGEVMYSLDARVLRNFSASHNDIRRTVKAVAVKPSFSDGLRMLPRSDPNEDAIFFGAIGNCGLGLATVREGILQTNGSDFSNQHLKAFDSQAQDGIYQVFQSNFSFQWTDTFAISPNTEGVNVSSSTEVRPSSGKWWVYFTTNRLQRYFTRSLDFSGKSGDNFRVFRFLWEWSE